MKIVHITPCAPYNDNWGYQDNLLPKYHAKLGHSVVMIATNQIHDKGRIKKIPCSDYYLEDGVHVYRISQHQYGHVVLTNLFHKLDVYEILEEIMPDFIFFHGLTSTTIFDVIKYKKQYPQCIIVQDNHLDYNISYKAKSFVGRTMIRSFYRILNRISAPYVSKVYGVTPWRKEYAEKYFKIDGGKTDVLIMGADDEKLDFNNRDMIRKDIREKYNIADSEFLIVTGGKIDQKKKIHLLMEACSNVPNVKLLIFGEILSDVQDVFDELIKKSNNIIHIGWIKSEEVYNYFFAADLVFFPGQHSVLWEQACAAKVPCVFEKWEGMNHVDNGGNSILIPIASAKDIKNILNEIVFTDRYNDMKNIAMSELTDIYLYSNIAYKSLETIRSQQCNVNK